MEKTRNYWLHRISHEANVSYPLLRENILSIGFSDFSEEELLAACINNYQEFNKRVTYSNKQMLWNFLSMKKGDIVVVPAYPEYGTFSIFEIEDDVPMVINQLYQYLDIKNLKSLDGKSIIYDEEDGYLYLLDSLEKKQAIDLGFFRRVKPIIENASRKDYADAYLTSKMKIRRTNANISSISESIEKAISHFGKNEPIRKVLSKEVSNIVKEASQKILLEIQTNLTPDKFEQLVRRYLEKCGASKIYVPSKNETDKEGDVDIIATFDAIKITIYVQVKFHKGVTNEHAMEQVIDYYKHNKYKEDIDGYTDVLWVVSTGKFSEEIKDEAKLKNVQLIDGEQFAEMLLNTGIPDLETIL